MDTKKHRHVFVMRILPRTSVENEDEKYTGFVRKFFYDPEIRETFLDYYDWDDFDLKNPFRIEKDEYLFSKFSYRDPETGEKYIQDYTHKKPYHLPDDKEYDSPEGIRLCAELNLDEYEKVLEAWNQYKDLYSTPPVSTLASGILNHYERVIADFRQWYIDNCPEYLPQLSGSSSEIRPYQQDRSRNDTMWLRNNKWEEFRDSLYKDGRLSLKKLRDAANKIPGGRPATLGDESLFKSFESYVNRKKRELSGSGSKRTAKVDRDEQEIILSKKQK